jgi:ribosomal protein S18 acetylase RimI-like enzyme
MSWADFDVWSGRSVRGFAAQQAAAGLVAEPDAGAAAEQAFADLLPDGLATPAHHLWTVRVPGGPAVGSLWLRLRPSPGPGGDGGLEAFVLDVEVLPAFRGRGLGRATMLAAETAAGRLGATSMALNVFGHNTTAMRLYRTLGYTVRAVTLTAHLDGASPTTVGCAPTVRPDGLWTAYDEDGRPVALLRLELQWGSDGVNGFAHVVERRAAADHRGYDRALLQATDRAARTLGARRVSVEIPGPADLAGEVYGWGFTLAAQTMQKEM